MYRWMLKLGLAVGFLISSAWSACPTPKEFAARLSSQPNPDTYADLGVWFSDHQQYTCAATAYRTGLNLQPESAKLNYLLGVALVAGGDAADAIKPLQESVRLAPALPKPHLVLADALEQLQRKDEARAEWAAALKIDPHSVVALDGLSKNLLEQGDYRSVIRLTGTNPHDQALILDLAMAYEKGEMNDRAEELLRKALQANPASEKLTGALVTFLVLQAHFEEGASLAKKSISLHPGDIDPQKLYLHVLVLNDDIELAKPLAAKLIKLAPHDFEVLYLNGVVEREQGEYPAAKAHLEEAVSINPNYYNSRYNLGVVLNELGDPKGAREQFEKALALGAWEPQIRFEYAKTLRALGETQLAEEQLKLYQQEEQAKANRTLAASKMAQAEKELANGNATKAIGLFRDAINALPQNAMLHMKLALALDEAGDTTSETSELQKTLELDSHMPMAHDQMGYLASQNGDYATAEKEFREAVMEAPDYTQAWVSLAATLGMEQRYAEAQRAIASALQLDPQNKNALGLRKDLEAAAAGANR